MWWPVVVMGEASLTISIYVGLLFLFLVHSRFWYFSCPDTVQSASVSWCWWVALLTAFRSAGGAFLSNHGSLCVGSGLTVISVASLFTKSAYLILLSDRLATPLV